MWVAMKTPSPAPHPPATDRSSRPWRPPVSDTVGWNGLSHVKVRKAALDDMEPVGRDRLTQGPLSSDARIQRHRGSIGHARRIRER